MYAHGPQCAVLGVDGCPGGWVGALVSGGGRVEGWHAGDLAAMLTVPADLVVIDIPIGLPADGRRRDADLQARALLGPARSSVFFTPPRVTLQADSHREATALSRSVGGRGVSIQTYWILRRIAEVDAALDRPTTAGRVVEAHPEVSFRAMAAGGLLPPLRPTGGSAAGPVTVPLLAGKKVPEGARQRLAMLQGELRDLVLPEPRPARATRDDCLDALACAWSGLRFLRGEAVVLGGDIDEDGRPMRIVC